MSNIKMNFFYSNKWHANDGGISDDVSYKGLVMTVRW